MVGVPGKYKGCNTCRVRRVKCDNERPLCKKCIDNGRQCGGYDRETVFIIGTIEDQGRCSSHPPRVLKNSASAATAVAAASSSPLSASTTATTTTASTSNSVITPTPTRRTNLAPGSSSASQPVSRSRKGKSSVMSSSSSNSINAWASPQSTQQPWGSKGLENQGFSSSEPGQQRVRPQLLLHEELFPQSSRFQSQRQQDKQPEFLSLPVSATSELLWPAWDDPVTLSTESRSYRVQVVTLHTNLQDLLVRDASQDSGTYSVYGGNSQGEGLASGASQEVMLRIPPYETPDLRPRHGSGDDFMLQSQSFLCLSPQDQFTASGEFGIPDPEGIFLFLYQHNNSALFTNQPPWRDPAMQNNVVRRLGSAHFRSFPNHQFFVHVYRHNAITAALLNRTPTFLADNDWLTVPWEFHPKTGLDRLLDILAVMPSLLFRADRICAQHPGIPRRLQAQDLLNNCVALERRLAGWYTRFQSGTADTGGGGGDSSNSSSNNNNNNNNNNNRNNSSRSRPSSSPAAVMDLRGPAFWMDHPHHHHHHNHPDQHYLHHGAQGGQKANQTARLMVPFADDFAFRDGAAAAVMCHYWAALVVFYPCIERVYWTIFEPILAGPPPAPGAAVAVAVAVAASGTAEEEMAASIIPVVLPPHLAALDTSRYDRRSTARAAGNVCRALDAAMADKRLLQPDLLGGPLFVTQGLFEQQKEQRRQEQEQHQQQLQLQLQLQQQMAMNGFGVGFHGVHDADAMMLDVTGAAAAAAGVDAEVGVGDGRLEIMWCEAFRARLAVRGREIAELAAGRRWQEMGPF